MKIALKAGGPRSVVSEEEAKEIRQRFERTLQSISTKTTTSTSTTRTTAIYKLDLSCRIWPLKSLNVLRDFFVQQQQDQQREELAAAVVQTIEILKIDDVSASLATDDGLASFQFFADVFGNSSLRLLLEEVNLNDNALGTRGMQVLQPLLTIPTLQRLYLNNTGLSAEVGELLLDILAVSSATSQHLTCLSLDRNQLGPTGAVAIGKLLAVCPSLQFFSYAGCRPLTEGTRHICTGLATAALHAMTLHQPYPLLQLDLNDCHLGTGQADNNNGDDDDDADTASPVIALGQVLQLSPGMNKLTLRDCGLQVAGLGRVLKALKTSKAHLQYIDLGANIDDDDDEEGDIDDDDDDEATALQKPGPTAAAMFADFCKETNQFLTLQTLIWGTNSLGNAGVAPLLTPFLADRSVLSSINLEENNITGAGARWLLSTASIGIPTLKHINLLENADLPAGLACNLKRVFENVVTEEDLPDDENDNDNATEDDAGMDDLVKALGKIKM